MRLLKIIPFTVIAFVGLSVGCGKPEEKSLRSEHSDESKSDEVKGDASQGEFNVIDTTKVDLRAVTMVAINKPYCRDGFETSTTKMAQALCTATVINDRFVLTAAHCFVSECPSRKNINFVDVVVPKAPQDNLSTFNWSNRNLVLPAVNVAFPYTFTGQFSPPGSTTSGYPMTSDIALVDFGSTNGVGNLKLAGYPKIDYRHPDKVTSINDSYPFNLIGVTYNSVGYATAFGSELKRESRQDIIPYNTSSLLLSNIKLPFVSFSRNNSGMGCGGDSGSPVIQNGVVAGITSVVLGTDYTAINRGAVTSTYTPACESTSRSIVSLGSPSNFVATQLIPLLYEPDYSVAPTGSKLKVDPIKTLMDKMVLYPPTIVSFKIDVDLRRVLMGTTYYDFSAYFRASYVNVKDSASSASTSWAPLVDGTSSISSLMSGGTIIAAKAVGDGTTTATWTATGLTQGYYKVEVFYQSNSGNTACGATQFQTYKEGTWSGIAPNYIWTPTSWKTLKARINQKTGTPSGGASSVAGWTPVYTNVTPMLTGGTTSSTYIFVSNDKNNSGNSGRLSIRLADIPQAGCVNERLVADTIRLTLIQPITIAPTSFNSNL